jgi:hypothetical protein
MRESSGSVHGHGNPRTAVDRLASLGHDLAATTARQAGGDLSRTPGSLSAPIAIAGFPAYILLVIDHAASYRESPGRRFPARSLAEERRVLSVCVGIGPGDRHEDARGAPRTPRSPGSLPLNRRGSLMRQANRGYTRCNRPIKIGTAWNLAGEVESLRRQDFLLGTAPT